MYKRFNDYYVDIKEDYNRLHTAVIVEPRKHILLEPIVLNIINNTDSDVIIQLFHGTDNLDYIMGTKLGDYVRSGKIILENLGVADLKWKEYNKLLVTTDFWNKVKGENILIFQTDSCICSKSKHKIEEFIDYDYVGSPWRQVFLDMILLQTLGNSNNNGVGNGGFSFRKRSAMLKSINNNKYKNTAEDVFYSGTDLNFPSRDKAKTFSVESVFYDSPYGIHKPWLYLDDKKLDELSKDCPEIDTIFNRGKKYGGPTNIFSYLFKAMNDLYLR